jgi:hypothetical protein
MGNQFPSGRLPASLEEWKSEVAKLARGYSLSAQQIFACWEQEAFDRWEFIQGPDDTVYEFNTLKDKFDKVDVIIEQCGPKAIKPRGPDRDRRWKRRSRGKSKEISSSKIAAALKNEEKALAQALCEYHCYKASKHEEVMKFREEILGGTLDKDQALALVGSKTLASIPLSALPAHIRKGIRNGERLNDADLLLAAATHRSEGEETQRVELEFKDHKDRLLKFAVLEDSVLGWLKEVSDFLSQFYDWDPGEATRFILTGDSPNHLPLKIRTYDNINDHHYCKLTLEFEPWLSAETVNHFVREQQEKLLASKKGIPKPNDRRASVTTEKKSEEQPGPIQRAARNRLPSLKEITIFRFILRKARDGQLNFADMLEPRFKMSWSALMTEYNQSVSKDDLKWTSSAKNFGTTAKEAVVNILFPYKEDGVTDSFTELQISIGDY